MRRTLLLSTLNTYLLAGVLAGSSPACGGVTSSSLTNDGTGGGAGASSALDSSDSSNDGTVGTGGNDGEFVEGGEDGQGGQPTPYCRPAGSPCSDADECCYEMTCKKRCCADVGQPCKDSSNCCEKSECTRGFCETIAGTGGAGGAVSCMPAWDDSNGECTDKKQCCQPLGTCFHGICCSQTGQGCRTSDDCCKVNVDVCDPDTQVCGGLAGTGGTGGEGPSCSQLEEKCDSKPCCDTKLDCVESFCCVRVGDEAVSCSSVDSCCGSIAANVRCTGGKCCMPTGEKCGSWKDCCSDTCLPSGICGPCLADGEACSGGGDCCSGLCNEGGFCSSDY